MVCLHRTRPQQNIYCALSSHQAPYCQHCKKLAPVLAELAERFNGKADPDGIRIGIVDCTKHTALCSEHGVAG